MGGKRIGRYLLGSSVLALVAASGSTASADTNEQLAAQLKVMQAQIEHLQRQIEQNNSAAAAARALNDHTRVMFNYRSVDHRGRVPGWQQPE